MSENPLDGLDFAYHPVCDVGDCRNPAMWVGYPGPHRIHKHDAEYVLVHMICDECKTMLEGLDVLICNTCKSQGARVEDLRLGDFYTCFRPLEVPGE